MKHPKKRRLELTTARVLDLTRLRVEGGLRTQATLDCVIRTQACIVGSQSQSDSNPCAATA